MADSSVGELELADYLDIVNRRKTTIIALVLATLALAILLSALQTPQFRASARVRVEVGSTDTLEDNSNTSTSVRARNLQNEVEFANSDRVADAAAAAFGEEINAVIAASNDSDTLTFTVVNANAETAANIANVFAGSYVTERSDSASERFTDASEVISERLVVIADERSQLEASRTAGADASSIDNQLVALDTEEAGLRSQLSQIDVIGQLNSSTSVSILNEAEPPAGAFSPSWVRNIGLALIAGLVLGMGVALVRESLDNTILTKRSLEKVMDGLPILGIIPSPHRSRFGTKRERRLITSRTGAFTEAYRSLHSSIELGQAAGSEIRSILVTSPNASEGKSTVAAHLAIAFARSGSSVIVIDADMHNPSQHQMFGLSNVNGLAEQLSNVGNAEIVTEQASGEGLLSVIPAGTSALPPADLLRSVPAQEFIEKLSYAYDIVIIDSPPLRPVTDTLPLARVADATLLVSMRGQTNASEVEEAIEMLARAQTRPLGGVLNGAEDGQTGYGYGYGYGASNSSRRR